MNKQPSVYMWVEGVPPIEVTVNKEVYWHLADGTVMLVVVRDVGPLELAVVGKEGKDVSRV